MERVEKLEAHDLKSALATLKELRVHEATSEDDAMESMRPLAQWNGCTIGLVRFSGETPWERHGEDELLHVLEGEVEVTILRADARVVGMARKGSVVLVPRGCWHRQHARVPTALLFVTGTTDISRAADPR
jgi:quercetin dioxygenase-like cupin family protein